MHLLKCVLIVVSEIPRKDDTTQHVPNSNSRKPREPVLETRMRPYANSVISKVRDDEPGGAVDHDQSREVWSRHHCQIAVTEHQRTPVLVLQRPEAVLKRKPIGFGVHD